MSKNQKRIQKRSALPGKRRLDRRLIVIAGIVTLALIVVVALVIGIVRGKPRPVEVVYRGISGGVTEEGFPYLGSLDASVVLTEFTDLNCSHCQTYNQESEEGILADYVATGQVRYIVHYYSSLDTQSLQAAEAAMCAADQGLYFQFQHAWFEASAKSREDFIARARSVGLNVGDFTACWDAGQHHNALLNYTQAARAMNINTTPTFMINDQVVVGNQPDVVRQAIEEELAGGGQ